jgi:type VI secretion system protein ImpH
VRFSVPPSLGFPASEIGAVTPGEGDEPARMEVNFLGLTGPAGVLPPHYTELARQRQREKDETLRDFLDVFHHRAVAFFYRAWEKYRLPVVYERHRMTEDGGPDPITHAFEALVGYAAPAERRALPLDPELLVRFGGHLASGTRSAAGLEAMLEGFTGVPVSVEQFQSEWADMSPGDTVRLPDDNGGGGRNHRLGTDFLIGTRTCIADGRVGIVLGPLDEAAYREWMPGTPRFKELCDLVRGFAGAAMQFSVTFRLPGDAVPPWSLDGARDGFRLGWNTWSGPPTDGAALHPVTASPDAAEVAA